jgi:hypothetical protein
MRREEAEPLHEAAQRAADWCRGKLEMREGGFGKAHEHSDSERASLHVAHSIALCEVARLAAIIKG